MQIWSRSQTFSTTVLVAAKGNAEVELRVRVSEWIVKLVICTVKNIHAGWPCDRRCNVQAKDERLHRVTLQYTVGGYAHSRSNYKRELIVLSRAQKGVPYRFECQLLRTEAVCRWADLGVGNFASGS